MKNTKKILSLTLAMLMALPLVACSSSSSDSSSSSSSDSSSSSSSSTAAEAVDDTVYTIVMGGTVPDEHPISQAQFEFEALAEELSGGRIQVEVFTNNTIGASRELLEGVQSGEIQMAECSQSMYASFTEELISVGLPFLFKNREAAYDFFDSEVGDMISEEITSQLGVHIVGYFENGIRQLTNDSHAITSPDDMAGMKFRVMESDLYIKMFELMGANPVAMSFSEVYTALQQGTVDGQDNPYAIVHSNKFYEVQDYMTDLAHTFDITCFCINEDFFQSLPADLQEIVLTAAEAAEEVNRSLSIANEEMYIEEIQAGGCEITFLTDEQRNVFKEATAPTYDYFAETYNPVVTLDIVMAMAEECNAAN